MDGHFGSWFIHPFIRSPDSKIKFSVEKGSFFQKSVLFDRSILYFPFYLSKYWLLTGQFCIEMFSIVALSTKKTILQFQKKKKVLVFQKTCFKVEVLKTLKISNDCHIKICQSHK